MLRGIISFVAVLTLLLCTSCKKEFQGFSGNGMRPVYVSFELLDDIGNLNPQPIEQSGPIYLVNDWFFMVEVGKGIHVFDIEDDEQESALTFINIPAISDFTIDGNTLFCDSWTDLLSIDISDIFNVQLLSRTDDIFDPNVFPPSSFVGPFECIDYNRGAVVGWESDLLDNVLCEAF